MRHALVTGGAGFIGSHLIARLLKDGWAVTVVDNFDDFYDAEIKRSNLAAVGSERIRVVNVDIRDLALLCQTLDGTYEVIVHLAARAGVRQSIEDAILYQQVNVNGTQNLLEVAKRRGIQQFIFASSSSVYGGNPQLPWHEYDALYPISPYAGTKLSGEILGRVYSYLHTLRFVGLRFFTVYGPGQRPDLAIHKFARMIRAGMPITVYGDGTAERDYTYIDDAIEALLLAMDYEKKPYEIFNVASGRPVSLSEVIRALEAVSGTPASVHYVPGQKADPPRTWADITKAHEALGYQPAMAFEDGISRFWRWFSGRHQQCYSQLATP